MTHTTQVEWHDDRPLVHFGNPGVEYWRDKPKPPKKKKPKVKEPKIYYPGRGKDGTTKRQEL